uniref:PPP1R35_C domain-containing protein n=1 Tax=Panagrellus redivivus TaxID=6233 RepID=A0A7E4UMB8_PANRE
MSDDQPGSGTASPTVPMVKNPAPHRGFSSKAREVLIDPSYKLYNTLSRHSSDVEALAARIAATKSLKRTDSELTNSSGKSAGSLNSCPKVTEEFDSLDDPVPKAKAKKTLSEIGKTRSAGDLLKQNSNNKKSVALIKTFQQMNIMKLPSVDSVNNSLSNSAVKLDEIDPIFEDERASAYKMK